MAIPGSIGSPAGNLIGDEGLDVLAPHARGIGRHPALDQESAKKRDRLLVGPPGLRREVLGLAG
jgi:hypothetical protein